MSSVDEDLRHGRYPAAVAALDSALDDASRRGPGGARLDALLGLTRALLLAGDTAAARERLTAALLLAGSDDAATARCALAQAALEQEVGDLAGAWTSLDAALERLDRAPSPELRAQARILGAELALANDNAVEAAAFLDDTEPWLAGAGDDLVLAAECQRLRLDLIGDPARSDRSARAERLRAGARATDDVDLRARILASLCEVAVQRRAFDEAAADAREAIALCEEVAAALPPEQARAFWSVAYRRELRRRDELLRSPAELRDPLAATAHQLNAIADILKRMNSGSGGDLPALLATIVDTMLDLCRGRRGFVIVQDGGAPRCEVARRRLGKGRQFAPCETGFSRGVIDRVMRTGRPLVLNDARRDPEFSAHDSVQALDLRSVLCLPLRIKQRQIGVVYLDNPLTDGAFADGEIRLAEILADQAAIAIENALLLGRAMHDAMTGVLNGSHFSRVLDEEASRARRHGKRFSLLLVDLDRFKRINDAHGHEAGSAILREATAAIVEALRGHDVIGRARVGRYGGDEFEVLLPETDRAGAAIVAERLLGVLRARRLRAAGGDACVTASIGMATFPDDAGDAHALFLVADDALYRAKREGRDRAVAAKV